MAIRTGSQVADKNINKSYKGLLRVSPVDGLPSSDQGVAEILSAGLDAQLSDSMGELLPIAYGKDGLTLGSETIPVNVAGRLTAKGSIEVSTSGEGLTIDGTIQTDNLVASGTIEGQSVLAGSAAVEGEFSAGSVETTGTLNVGTDARVSGSLSVCDGGQFVGDVSVNGSLSVDLGSESFVSVTVQGADIASVDSTGAVHCYRNVEVDDNVLMNADLSVGGTIRVGTSGANNFDTPSDYDQRNGLVVYSGGVHASGDSTFHNNVSVEGTVLATDVQSEKRLFWSNYCLGNSDYNLQPQGDTLALLHRKDDNSEGVHSFEVSSLEKWMEDYIANSDLAGAFAPVGTVSYTAIRTAADGCTVSKENALDGFFLSQPKCRGRWDICAGQNVMSYVPSSGTRLAYTAGNFPALYTLITGKSATDVPSNELFNLPDLMGRFVRSWSVDEYNVSNGDPTKGGYVIHARAPWSTSNPTTNDFQTWNFVNTLKKGGGKFAGQGTVGMYTTMPQDRPGLWQKTLPNGISGAPQGVFYDTGVEGWAGNEGKNRRNQKWRLLGFDITRAFSSSYVDSLQSHIREPHPLEISLVPIIRVK